MFSLWLMITLLFFLNYAALQKVPPMIFSQGSTNLTATDQFTHLRHSLGFDRPVYVQYGDWIWSALHGDWGKSYWTGATVTEMMSLRFPFTFSLMGIAMLFTSILTIPIGMFSALKRKTFIDYGLRGFQLGFISIPSFWIGILLFSWIVVRPKIEYATLLSDPLAALRQYSLPAIIMGLSAAAISSRMLRSSILGVMNSDYIRTAPKGLRKLGGNLRPAGSFHLRRAGVPVARGSGDYRITLQHSRLGHPVNISGKWTRHSTAYGRYPLHRDDCAGF